MKKLVLVFFLVLLGCTPTTSGSIFNLLPEQKEIEIGKSYVPYAIEENEGLYPDKRVQEYVKTVGESIARHTPRRLPYQFFVVNSDAVNAFALPGGPVFITRGLLLKLNSESELAGVLGHELGHINARHHAKFLEKMYAINILFGIGAILLQNKPYGQALLQFGEIGGQLLALKFSRDQEREADRLGVVYTLRAGYDPMGLIRVFEMFKSMERVSPPEWLLTHPLPESRIRETSTYIQSIKPSGVLIEDTQEFHKIKELIKKTDPSFKEFYDGKKAYRQRDYQRALMHFNRAVELYEDNYMAHLYISYILAKGGDVRRALLHSEKAYSIMPNVFLTNYVYGFVLFKAGRFEESLRKLESAKRLIPDYPDTYYYAGRDYEALGDIQRAIQNYQLALELSKGNAEWSADARERLRRLRGM